ncbi:E2-like conjugating enzyme atg10 [Orobanche gracilis]
MVLFLLLNSMLPLVHLRSNGQNSTTHLSRNGHGFLLQNDRGFPIITKVGYLSLENVILSRLSEEYHSKGNIEKQECVGEYEDEIVDTAVVQSDSSNHIVRLGPLLRYDFRVQNDGPGVHHYDFHAVYSTSYRVPALYFRAFCNDGQPLGLDEIKKDMPVHSAELLARSKWTFITQEDHPDLSRPWYTLHPCGTSEWMKLLFSTDESSIAQGRIPVEKFMISWFSVVGQQVFGLKLCSEMLNI